MTETGEEALDRAAVIGPHAAIVDLMLPDSDGIEVCRQLRGWSEMPIIVLSALGEEAVKIEALESGADDYVTKPFGPGELVARVQAALRRAGRGAAEPRIEVDGLVVDLAAHAVWLDGEEVRLTPIEFSLLRVLAAQPGPVDDPPPAPDRGVGSRARRCHATAAHAHREPAGQAGRGRGPPLVHPHRRGRGLPVQGPAGLSGRSGRPDGLGGLPGADVPFPGDLCEIDMPSGAFLMRSSRRPF